jgi:hypothetical protein
MQPARYIEPQQAPKVGQLRIDSAAEPAFERGFHSARETCEV